MSGEDRGTRALQAELDAVPETHRTEWWKCGHCEHLHVVLFDEDDRVVGKAIFSRSMLVRMLDAADETLGSVQ